MHRKIVFIRFVMFSSNHMRSLVWDHSTLSNVYYYPLLLLGDSCNKTIIIYSTGLGKIGTVYSIWILSVAALWFPPGAFPYICFLISAYVLYYTSTTVPIVGSPCAFPHVYTFSWHFQVFIYLSHRNTQCADIWCSRRIPVSIPTCYDLAPFF